MSDWETERGLERKSLISDARSKLTKAEPMLNNAVTANNTTAAFARPRADSYGTARIPAGMK